jgi:hypothetical protein
VFGNWLNGIDKDVKLEYALVFQLCVGPYGQAKIIVYLKNIRIIFLQVVRLIAHWIQLLLDQREHMVIGCNQLLTVVHDFYF